MAEKAEDNAAARQAIEEEAEEEEEIPSDRESEEGMGHGNGFEDEGGPSSSPVKKAKPPTPAKSPKKKKVTSAGMQIPEHWPWEEAKQLFLKPDVIKGEELEVGVVFHRIRFGSAGRE